MHCTVFPDALEPQLSHWEVHQGIKHLRNCLTAEIAIPLKIDCGVGTDVMDPSFIFSHGWDPTGGSLLLELLPYPTLVESCDAHCDSYRLVSYTFIMEKYLNSPCNYVQYF